MKPKYGSLIITLHWGMLLVIAAVYVSIELRELYPKGSDIREGMKAFHFMLGMSVLAFVFIRLAVRMFGASAPKIEPIPAAGLQLMSSAMHIALYVFMIALPLAGWALLSAAGKPIPFGLPALMGANEGLAHTIKEVHEIGANVGLALIGLHAAAALFHHYVVRDNTLRRILPMAKA
jgi:superoxide oxidase